jgi:phosphatidylinositol glycan class K
MRLGWLAIFWVISLFTPLIVGQSSEHTSNWAVLVDTSKFWLNYRHESNILSFYRTLKRLGMPDSNIIVMVGDDFACNARNPFPAMMFNDADHKLNLYDEDVVVDYRGSEVSVENFLRLLIGAHAKCAACHAGKLAGQAITTP